MHDSLICAGLKALALVWGSGFLSYLSTEIEPAEERCSY